MIAKVFLAAVAQPDSEFLGDLFLLLFRQPVVKREGAFSFMTTGSVAMSVPEGAGEPNTAGGLFHQGGACEVFITLFVFLSRHGDANG